MRKCFFGYSHLTTVPSYYPKCTLCIVITMYNFKVVAWLHLWVYNTENLCVSFFNQVASIFHLGGKEMKKRFLGLPILYTILSFGHSYIQFYHFQCLNHQPYPNIHYLLLPVASRVRSGFAKSLIKNPKPLYPTDAHHAMAHGPLKICFFASKCDKKLTSNAKVR